MATMTDQKPRVSTESFHGPHPDIKVIDFATIGKEIKGSTPELERKRSLRKRIVRLVWNPRARHFRRGLVMKMLQEDPNAVDKRRMSLT